MHGLFKTKEARHHTACSGTRKTYPNSAKATESDYDKLQEVSDGEESTSEKSDAGDAGAPNSDACKPGRRSNRRTLEPKDFEEKGKEWEIVEISSDEGENQLYTE